MLPLDAAGPDAKFVTVYLRGDTLKEADGTFFVNLSSLIDAQIAKGRAKG
jgi:hypothetical protein